jgi:G3E family GTPase
MLSIGHEFAQIPAMYALALWPIGIVVRAVEHAESRKCFEAVMSGQTVPDQYSRIPLTIVAGASGAGKSSLVRHLLSQTTEQIAAVVADASAVDPSLVAQRDGARLLLKNGSVCVMSDDDGSAVLATLSEQSQPPDHVVFESAAASNPRRLLGYGYMPGYYLDGMIMVVDAASLAAYANDLDAQDRLREQLSYAALVVVNKIDLIDDTAAEAAQRVLSRVAPMTPAVSCERAQVAPSLVLGAPKRTDSRAVVAEWSMDYMPVRRQRTGPRVSRAPDAERCRSWCLIKEMPIDRHEFRIWVQRLPSTVLSGRGVVHLRDDPYHRHFFHLMGPRWRLERGRPWGRDTPSTRLRLAGLIGRRRTASRVADGDAEPEAQWVGGPT